MYELLILVKAAYLVELLLDIILHSLHVVIGHLLNVLHPLSIGRCELAIDVTKTFKEAMVEILKCRQWQLTKSDKIFYFNAYAITYQCIL